MPASGHIAIIGMSCRFPGARNLDAFWNVLIHRETTTTPLTIDAHSSRASEGGLQPLPAFGVLEGIDRFDRELFGLSQREASILDPQQRVWLECVWRALEDAGHGDPHRLRAGVFAGCNRSHYLDECIRCDPDLALRLRSNSSSETRQILNGNDKDFLATRTSFLLNLTGPSANVQSACSTALVAIATACQSLAAGESDLCVAGGVSIVRTTDETRYFEPESIHSPDGICRPFDAAANGAVFGDGAGVVILRRLEDAVADGDRVYAVIRGWAINNDGREKASFTGPSARAQADVVRAAQSMAEIDPGTVGYVEAHGTGTRVGDPIEFEGLCAAFRGGNGSQYSCGLGSVKSNIGHLDVAAGAAGLIKTALALHHGRIPGMPNFRQANPLLGIEGSPFRICATNEDWAAGDNPRRAGVSSFGVGGTNCHIVLEEAPANRANMETTSVSANVLAISAQNASALRTLIRRHAQALRREPLDVEAYCFSAATGRRHLARRKAFPAQSRESLLGVLNATDEENQAAAQAAGRAVRPRIGFLFSGQLGARVGMTRDLFLAEPLFRDTLLRCEEVLEPHLDKRLTEILFDASPSSPTLASTRYAQPALFACQYALATLWTGWGVRPAAVLGFSLGEYAAACIAEAATLEEILPLVAARGRLMDELRGDVAMLSVLAPRRTVDGLLQATSGSLCIAASMGEEASVLSGPKDDIRSFEQRLGQLGHPAKRLSDRYAFHSAWLDPCLPELRQAAEHVSWRPPGCLFASTLSGELESDALVQANYWVRQAREPVALDAAVAALRRAGIEVFLEIGPDAALTPLTRLADVSTSIARISSLRRGQDDLASLSAALAEVYETGAEINWEAVYAHRGLKRIPVPRYPFQRRSCWFGLKAPPSGTSRPDRTAADDLLGERVATSEPATICFRARWTADSPTYMKDHRLFGRIVAPASSHLAMLMQAVETAFASDNYVLEDLVFVRPVVIPATGVVDAKLTFGQTHEGRLRVELAMRKAPEESGGDEAWNTSLTGELRFESGPSAASAATELAPDAVAARYRQPLSGDHFYAEIWAQGEGTGPSFRQIDSLHVGDDEALACLSEPGPETGVSFVLHPGIIEACFQTLYAARDIETSADLGARGRTLVPYTIRTVRVRQPRSRPPRWCRARCLETWKPAVDDIVGDLAILDGAGQPVMEVRGFHLRPLAKDLLGSDLGAAADHVYREVLEPAPLTRPASGAASTARWLIVAATERLAKELAKRVSGDLGNARVVTASSVDGAPDWLPVLDEWATAPADDGSADAPRHLGILYLDSIGEGALGTWSTVDFRSAVSACRPLLEVLRSLCAPSRTRVSLLVVSVDEQPNAGAGGTSPRFAPLWGLTRVAMTERPDVEVALVSLESSTASHRLAEQVLAETGNITPGEQIYVRNGVRHRSRLAPYRLPKTLEPLQLRQDRSYLVAGSSSGQALACAQWLLRQGAGRVVLADTVGEEAPSSREQLRHPGSLVEEQIDLSTIAGCEDFLRRTSVSNQPFAGVVFVPWLMDDGILEKQSWERFRDAVTPIVDGAANLAAVTAGYDSAFFLCFSSAAAVAGTPGQASYAAACSFLDTLCRRIRSRGRPALSINWGPWASAGHWSALPEAKRRQLADRGWHPVETDEALSLTAKLMTGSEANLAVMPVEWHREGETTRIASIARLAESGRAPVQRRNDSASERIDNSQTVRPIAGRKAIVERLVAEALGDSDGAIDENLPLSSLGLDSLMAVGLRNALRREIDIDVPLIHLLEDGTLRSIETMAAEQGTVPLAEEQPVAGTPSLVALGGSQDARGESPLFGLHWVSAYREIASALSPECLVYGTWMAEEDDLLALAGQTVEHLASAYLQRIRRHQERGPYRLMGSSFAGLLAFEAAQQLVAGGEQVSLVALIDCNTPDVIASRWGRVARVAKRLGRDGPSYVTGGLANRVRKVLTPAHSSSLAPAKNPSSVRQAFQRAAIQRYRPAPYPGRVILFVSERNSFNFERPADLGWVPYAGGGLVIHRIAGDHHGMLRGEGARSTARLLTEYLGKA